MAINLPAMGISPPSAGGDFGPEIELDMVDELDAYTITKPFDHEKVLKFITKLLSHFPSRF